MTTGRSRRPALRAALLAALAVATVGPMMAPAAARTEPTTGSRQIITPYMGMRDFLPNRSLVKDKNGVALASYGGTLGNQYNPVTIAQAAIQFYNGVTYGKESAAQQVADRNALIVQVEWLVANQQPNGLWLYRYPWAGQPVPWVSAMAQGQAMSALIRANAVRPDPRYLAAIARARSTFERTWSRSGIATWQRVGARSYLVYEEYMAPYSPHTLNGWMFAMIGLHEAWTYLQDEQARFDLMNPDRGVPALRALLPYYDTGSWSTYNLKRLDAKVNGTIARFHYHELHIQQLRWFAKATNDAVFEVVANRWQRYLDACLATKTCPA